MDKQHVDICPVCENTEFRFKYSCIDSVSSDLYIIEECSCCGLLVTQDFIDKDDYSDDKYFSYEQKAHLARKVELVKEHTKSKAPWLLDIETGTGCFLSEIVKHGWSGRGVERNVEKRSKANKVLYVSCYEPEKLKEFEEYSFGVITLWHSLPHYKDPNGLLKIVNKLLVENGTVFVAIPNVGSSDAIRYKENWGAFDVPRNKWHFTVENFTQLVKKNGFGIEVVYPISNDAIYVSKLSEKNNKRPFRSISARLFGIACSIKVMRSFEKSSSLIYVLRKSEVLNFHV